jgi:hypothetical protein
MLFSKVSKNICQKINNKMWDKGKETLGLTQSAAYTNVRGKKCLGIHSTHVCYGHRKDLLGEILGHYSLLPNTRDEIKKKSMRESEISLLL